MTKTIDIFFDYVCPYSYIACRREDFLKKDMDVEFNWRSWETFPERSLVSYLRDDLRYGWAVTMLAKEIEMDITMPRHVSNTNMALRGLEYAKTKGRGGEYNRAVFDVHWDEKKDISDIEVLKEVCSRIGLDPDEFEREMENPEYGKILEENEREVERLNVQLVPSYILGDRIVVGNIRLSNLKKDLKKYLRT
jgi:predicted DsbA family dithiol-disulfide isomerase